MKVIMFTALSIRALRNKPSRSAHLLVCQKRHKVSCYRRSNASVSTRLIKPLGDFIRSSLWDSNFIAETNCRWSSTRTEAHHGVGNKRRSGTV